MPVLRRPYDHCRGLCPRRRTARPALRRWDPDLILMTFLPSPGNIHSPEHSVPGVATRSPWYLRTLARQHRPVPDQAIEHRSSDHPAVITGAQLSAILAKPSTATAAQTSNRHSRPGAHRLPAGSFIGGFRTPAPLARVDRSRWAGIRNPNRKRSFAEQRQIYGART